MYCVALPCCLFDLACFFLPSSSSLIKICMCITDKEAKQIQDRINTKRYLQGVVIIFCCTVAKGCKPLQGLESAAQMVHDVYEKLGHLPVWIKENVSSHHITDYIKILTKKITLPRSYRYITVYFTGHGVVNAVCTADGRLEIRRIVEPFRQDYCPKFKNIIKTFVFDCCRAADRRSPTIALDHTDILNSIFVFATVPWKLAFWDYTSRDQAKLCGNLTKILVKLMRKENRPYLRILEDAKKKLGLQEFDPQLIAFQNSLVPVPDGREVNFLSESVGECK